MTYKIVIYLIFLRHHAYGTELIIKKSTG